MTLDKSMEYDYYKMEKIPAKDPKPLTIAQLKRRNEQLRKQIQRMQNSISNFALRRELALENANLEQSVKEVRKAYEAAYDAELSPGDCSRD